MIKSRKIILSKGDTPLPRPEESGRGSPLGLKDCQGLSLRSRCFQGEHLSIPAKRLPGQALSKTEDLP